MGLLKPNKNQTPAQAAAYHGYFTFSVVTIAICGVVLLFTRIWVLGAIALPIALLGWWQVERTTRHRRDTHPKVGRTPNP